MPITREQVEALPWYTIAFYENGVRTEEKGYLASDVLALFDATPQSVPEAGEPDIEAARRALRDLSCLCVEAWSWKAWRKVEAYLATPPAAAPEPTEAMVDACIDYDKATWPSDSANWNDKNTETAREFYRGLLRAALSAGRGK